MLKQIETIAGVLLISIFTSGLCRGEEVVVEENADAVGEEVTVGENADAVGEEIQETVAAEEIDAVVGADDEAYRRARYDVIVDRSPFGEDPLVDEEQRKVAAAAQALEKDYRLCFLLESESGEVRAGFQNKKAKTGEPKSVILMVGESHGAMKLLDIDLENASARLQYQGREVTFELSKAPVPAPTPAKPSAPTKDTSSTQRRFGGGFRRTTPPETEVESTPEPQVSAEEAEQRREEVRAALQEYQMEVLRKGQPPLPVQLSPDQDDQLVSEGVLEPLD
jgi:hypothetical protein